MKQIIYATLVALLILSGFTSYAQADSSTTFKVSGACGQCEQRIEKALKIRGIKTAKWDENTQMLAVMYDPSIITLRDIHKKVAAVGHDTELEKASDAVYKALPECCHYREIQTGDAAVAQVAENLNHINGVVLSEDNKGNFTPLAGASIVWLGTGKGTASDKHGVFTIAPDATSTQLVISYTGYKSDTLTVADKNDMQIILAANNQLNAIKVATRYRNTYINNNSPFRVATITSRELLKAACCNLSESFETNPSVDVSYNDAVTGSKQIQLLGLSGNYTQLTVENLPGPRGIATPLGLNSIAGPWVESIQLSKGTGSVVNGFESIAGQINVELKKPENSERLYVNGYVNSMGKSDVNLNLSQPLGKKWSTGILLHDDFLYTKTDFNKDNFRDLPTGNLFSALNRWKFDNGKGLMAQFGAKVLLDDRTGGELVFQPGNKFSTDHYGLGIKTDRYEGFAKIGYVFPGKKYQSIGLQLSAFDHQQDAYFGQTVYNAQQRNFYSNLIYQSIIGTTAHKFRTGLSFQSDQYNELYRTTPFNRDEVVPGAFFEYTFTPNEKITAVAGIRADHNSLFGWFATPRLNVRYEPVTGTTIRVSAGRGQRTANIFAENMGVLVSARNISILSAAAGKAHGLDPEVAWNKGITVDQKFKLFGNDALLSLDYFRNDFQNQVIVDLENVRQVKFYNLDGNSYSNSFQTEVSLTPVQHFDLRLAYRWYDVKSTYGKEILEKPLTAAHRAFANVAYETGGWKFDYTANYVGSKRIPSTAMNPSSYQLPGTSPAFVTMNAQVSKSLGKDKAFEVYVGGENLSNYFQQNAILSADQPFSPYFDASMIWGPVNGRTVYGGFRYRIK